MNNVPEPIFEPTFLNLEYVFYKITLFFENLFPFLKDFFTSGKLGAFFVFFFSILLVLVVAWITYSMIRISEIKRKRNREMSQALFVATPEDVRQENPRWKQVQEHINSQNPAEWRLAIIEADLILEDLTNRIGLPGENLGERLKNAEPSDFLTLQNAWEGHKVRNRIAHEGSAFNLTYKEARQAVDHFEEVFREFEFI
jgi:hypothetical protein